MPSNSPYVSIVVPTKNEEVSVAQFIQWCNEGFTNAGVTGEILLMDNSSDRTPEIARELGATVIHVPEPGLGNAYNAAKGHINGEIVILGDADCTYDFRELTPFIQGIENGSDFVMGTRFKGSIEKGAMPPHHQYFGSPATSFLFKAVLGIPVSDIHCGMRATTISLYKELPFLEPGWLYASEMIVSARNLGANISEVPIKFLKEPEGRLSHHVRGGWTSPFIAGWGTLRVITTYSVDRLVTIPSAILSVAFMLLSVFRLIYPNFFSSLGIGVAAGAALSCISIAFGFSFCFGVLSGCLYDKTNTKVTRWLNNFRPRSMFNYGILAFVILFLTTVGLIANWIISSNEGGSIMVITPIWITVANISIGVVSLAFTSLFIDLIKKERLSQ